MTKANSIQLFHSHCYTWAISECYGDKQLIIKRHINSESLPYPLSSSDTGTPVVPFRQQWWSFEYLWLPHIQEIINKRWLQLFGHVVRLESNVPAHRALRQAICVRGNIRPDSRWRRPCGRPRQRWLHHIADGSSFGIRMEWHMDTNRGHGSRHDGPLLSTRSNEWWMI